ncbi:MAG: bifunctional riboflavin kinase/FAD synthetase [Lachnospiraceae bacterium]|nr:bifunctional riboflavin kinase/FAD synthetase [Lachnospiraceae bacterium]
MIIISDTLDFKLNSRSAVAIGKFDGVHLGHRELMQTLMEKKEEGLMTCVFTFDPSPAVLFGMSDGKELTTKAEKRKIFEEMGIDVLVEFPLSTASAAIPAEDFVKDYLVERLRAKWIVAGEDVSFGAKGTGNAALLNQMAETCDFSVTTISKIAVDGREISSSYIRELVESGEMEKAKKFLGTPYSISGEVSHGKKLGRTIGMPTINVLPGEDKLLPPKGVYYSSVVYNGVIYKAISNVGYKPTVTDEKIMGVESFLFDYEGDLYGKEVTILLHAFKRPEMKFDSVEALKEQMHLDKLEGAKYLPN